MQRPLTENLYDSPTKFAFVGNIMPSDEGRFRDNYGAEELVLRCRPDTPMEPGDEMFDELGRRFLLLDFDKTSIAYSFRLVRLTDLLVWSRLTTVIDPVTKAKRDGVAQPLGQIWVNLTINGQISDGVIKVKQDTRRVITRSPLQLGDKIGSWVVQRIDHVLGVYVAEVQ